MTITKLIDILEFANPEDKIGILDPTSGKIYELKTLVFNADTGAYILKPNMSNRLQASSMLAKKKRREDGKS